MTAVTRRLAAENPEAWVYAAAAAAWAALLLSPVSGALAAFCFGDESALATWSFAAGATLATFAWPAALLHWLLMVAAMMLPLTAMALRHVALRSFRARRGWAMAVFIAGYALVWLAAVPVYAAAAFAGRMLAGEWTMLPLGAALALTAFWQAMPAKRRALRRCHRTAPLAPSGWQADRDAFGFGLDHGRACLASCWPLMLVAVAAGHQPAVMLAAGLFALVERRLLAPEPRRSAGPFAAAAMLCLAIAAI
jgi:predicted metal-binding membrane protein